MLHIFLFPATIAVILRRHGRRKGCKNQISTAGRCPFSRGSGILFIEVNNGQEDFMMNQGKIGAFISERRKAKGWTQSQLAENLASRTRLCRNGKQGGLCQTYLCLCRYVLY